MPDAHDELAMPGFEDRLWSELHQLHARRQGQAGPPPGPAPRRRWRPGPRALLAVVGTAAAAAAVAVLVVGDGTVPGSRPQAAEASVEERVLAATEPDAGDSIIHQVRTPGDQADADESWYDEVTGARRERTLTADGDVLVDIGWPEPPAADEPPLPTTSVLGIGDCDPGTRLALDADGNLRSCVPTDTAPPQPMHAVRRVDHCRREYSDVESPVVAHPGWGYLRMYLETGDIVEDGTEQVDGRELIRLRNHDSSYVYLVDPETYLPVQEIVAAAPGGTARTVTTFERLERTPDNLALLTPPVPDGFAPAPVLGTFCNALPPEPDTHETRVPG